MVCSRGLELTAALCSKLGRYVEGPRGAMGGWVGAWVGKWMGGSCLEIELVRGRLCAEV